MGCGCSGSTRTAQAGSRRGEEKRDALTREHRTGGPGEEGYYWTGPKRTAAPSEPAKA